MIYAGMLLLVFLLALLVRLGGWLVWRWRIGRQRRTWQEVNR